MASGSVQDLVARLRTGLAGARKEGPRPAARPGLQEGDLRHVAILFLDVRGFTGIAEQLAPDELSLFIHQTVFQSFSEAIAEHRGVVLQFLGDAIYAIFPPTVARIDPREMACRAALAILQQVEAILPVCREANLDIAVRIGVNYGKIALSKVQVGERQEWTGAGDAINVAKRLETAAPPNSALVLDELKEAMEERFHFTSFGRQTLKGKSEERELFVLGPARAHLHQTDNIPTVEMVGRQKELSALQEALSEGATVLEGEAGIGKSRLADEARFMGVRAQCIPYGRQLYGALLAWMRGLHLRLGMEVDKLQELLESQKQLDPRARQLQVQLAFKSFFHEAAREAEKKGIQLALRLEDAQWLDEGSQGVLRFLYQGSGPLPLVVTTRIPLDWLEPRLVLKLEPLDAESMARLLDSLLGLAVADGTRQVLLDRAAGNPFVLGELVAQARECQGLVHGPEGLDLTEEAREQLPASVEGAVLARVDRLDPSLKSTLQAAAVLGREFTRAHLGRVCRGAGLELTDQLERLEAEGLLQRSTRPRTGWSDEGEIHAFSSGLVQEVVAGSLLVQNRRLLHRLVLEVLEPAHAASPGRLAYHAEEAHDWGRALTYHVAQARAAFEGSHFRAVQAALEGAELAAHKLNVPAHTRMEIMLLQLETLEQMSHFDSALELVERGLELTSHYPDLELQFRARKGLLLLRKSRLEEAEQCLREVLARNPPEELVSDVQYALGSVDYDRGDYEAAREHFRAALNENPRQRARGLRSLAFVELARGRVPEAIAQLEEALSLARQVQDIRMEGNLEGSLGLAHQKAGRLEEACVSFREALECSRLCQDIANQSIWWVNLGNALLGLERLGEAEEACAHCQSLAKKAGYPAVMVEACVGLAEIHRRRGDQDRAREVAAKAAADAAELGQPVLEGQACLVLARLGDARARERARDLALSTGDAALVDALTA